MGVYFAQSSIGHDCQMLIIDTRHIFGESKDSNYCRILLRDLELWVHQIKLVPPFGCYPAKRLKSMRLNRSNFRFLKE